MIDLLLRNARVAGQDTLSDLGVTGDRLVTGDAATAGGPAGEVIDLGGRLVTPPLVEPHIT
jgi:cytosine deaminase